MMQYGSGRIAVEINRGSGGRLDGYAPERLQPSFENVESREFVNTNGPPV